MLWFILFARSLGNQDPCPHSSQWSVWNGLDITLEALWRFSGASSFCQSDATPWRPTDNVFGDLNTESFSFSHPFIGPHFLGSEFYLLPLLEVGCHNWLPQAKLKIFLNKTYAPLNGASRLSQGSLPKDTSAAGSFISFHRPVRPSSCLISSVSLHFAQVV